MRKIIITTIFLFTLYPLYSYQLGLGNDLLAMNIISPVENATTYSFYSETPIIFETNLSLDYTMITNNSNDKRLDQTTILLGRPFNIINLFKIEPFIGVTIFGDLEGKEFWDTSDYDAIFTGELLFSKENLLIPNIKNSSKLTSDVYSEIVISPGYSMSANVGSSLIFKGNSFLAKLGYRYQYRYNFIDSDSLNYARGLADEGKINFSITSGNFRYDLNLFLDGSFATGKYSLILGELSKATKLETIDIKVFPGSEYDINSGNYLSCMAMDITPFDWELSRIGFNIKSTYGWNKPGFKNANLNELYYNETHYNKILLGSNINLFENDSFKWFSPFAGVAFGLENYHYYSEYDTDKLHIIPVYEIKAGLDIYIPQLFVKDNIQYGINSQLIYRNSFNYIEYKNNFLINLGLVVIVEL